MSALDKFHNSLNNPVRPGQGCHSWIMSTANLGAIAKLTGEDITSAIKLAIPPGSRRIQDKEIIEAVKKALQDHSNKSFIPIPKPEPIAQDSTKARQGIINQGNIEDEVDLWEASPIRLWDEPQEDPVLFLRTLYKPDDLIFIGNKYDLGIIGKTIRSCSEWITYFQAGGETYPHIIINPLNGILKPTESGDEMTLRGNANIKAFRYVLIEFDTLNRDEQIRFWSAIKLPVIALIDSGGKSIHAWLDVAQWDEVLTVEQWNESIKYHLFDKLLTPLGVDPACKNQARLSRLPGHFRTEKSKYQRLLWLSAKGDKIKCQTLKSN